MYNYILIILSLIRLGDGTQKIDSYLWHQVQVDRPCGVGNIYKTTLDIGLLDCALLCMLEQPRCMAFNFNIFKICTLFNGSVNAFYTQTNYCQFYQLKKLPDLEVYRNKNFAQNSSVTSSSVCISPQGGSANSLTDGLASWEESTCSCTSEEPGMPNWFVVKLQMNINVTYVAVTTRNDIGGYKTKNFIVRVMKDFDPRAPLVYTFCTQYPKNTHTNKRYLVACDEGPIEGSYVMLKQPKNGFGDFTVCEVEVFGTPIMN